MRKNLPFVDDGSTSVENCKTRIFTEIIDFINENGIENFAELVNICMDSKRKWFRFIVSNDMNSYVLYQYIKSAYVKNHPEAAQRLYIDDDDDPPSAENS